MKLTFEAYLIHFWGWFETVSDAGQNNAFIKMSVNLLEFWDKMIFSPCLENK